MFNILKGEPVKQDIEKYIIENVEAFRAKGIGPKLAVIRVGEDPGQIFYEKSILRASEKYGIETELAVFTENYTQQMVEDRLEALNGDEDVYGIILLRPFPEDIDTERLRKMLDPAKDIDAITDISIAQLFSNEKDALAACTAEACMEMLKWYDIGTSGKKVTVLGRSLTVGKPVAMMLTNADANVTVCHTKTDEADKIAACRNADIVVLATGNTCGFGSKYFTDGQVILDVGTGIGKDGKMHGDLDIEEIMNSGEIKSLTYTPVPGGIGTVTTALLLRNIIKAVKNKEK